MASRVRFPDAEPRVHRIMVIITAFQAEDLGSIPSGRSKTHTIMNIYFDTEFTSLSSDANLISAGFVTEYGSEFYAEITDFGLHNCSDFVKQNVLPLLDGKLYQRLRTIDFCYALADWLNKLDSNIVLLADSTWDASILCNAYYHVKGIKLYVPNLTHKLVYFEDDYAAKNFEKAYKEYFLKNPGKEHHALHDARALRSAHLQSLGYY